MRQGNAHLGEQIQVGVVADLEILAVPVNEAGQAMRQFHAEQATDDDRVRMPLDDLLGLALDRGKCLGEQRHAGRTSGPRCALEALPAFQPAVAEAVSERLLFRTEDVDAERPISLDQGEGRGLTIDADQYPRRGGAQRRQRGDSHAGNFVATPGGDDGNAAGKATHERAELAFDFGGLVDEVDVRLAHWSSPSPAPRRLCLWLEEAL